MDKPVVLQLGPYPETDQAALDERFTMLRHDLAEDRAALLQRHAGDIRAIAARGIHRVPAELIAALPALQIIAIYGVGYDGVDLEACRARGIRVTNTPDVLTGDVADLGVAMMLALSRRMVQAERWVRGGDWLKSGGFPLTRRVHGARAGILGLGRIGTAVAKRLSGFEMELAYSDVAEQPGHDVLDFVSDPVDLAARSDFLFITLAASDATRHIVGREVLQALGPQGVIINISRAANVDEEALIAALQSGAIAGAALDVFEGEPRIDPRFLALDNVLLQPHHASGTVETRHAMGQLMRDNLAAHFEGRPLPTPVI